LIGLVCFVNDYIKTYIFILIMMINADFEMYKDGERREGWYFWRKEDKVMLVWMKICF